MENGNIKITLTDNTVQELEGESYGVLPEIPGFLVFTNEEGVVTTMFNINSVVRVDIDEYTYTKEKTDKAKVLSIVPPNKLN